MVVLYLPSPLDVVLRHQTQAMYLLPREKVSPLPLTMVVEAEMVVVVHVVVGAGDKNPLYSPTQSRTYSGSAFYLFKPQKADYTSPNIKYRLTNTHDNI